MDSRVKALLFFSAVLAVVVIVVVAGRGGDSDDSGSSATGSTDLTDTSTKPKVEPPEGDLPTELASEDIVPGTGAEAKTGDQVSVQYVGIDAESGDEFDASWDGGTPFDFQLGGGQVIPGWDQGVVGMKVGGRRKLTIPPDLAYGPAGQPPDIGPDATLVFVIDLLDVTTASKEKTKPAQ